MRIAWFTPFSNKSAIGKYSKIIIQELVKYCDVDLFLCEKDKLLETQVKIYFYNSNQDLSSVLKNYDLVIYNIGDCLDFHKDIYEVSQKNRGIVILHDYVMHHFFAGYYLRDKKDPDTYIRKMKLWYGEDGESLARMSVQGQTIPIWETDEVINYPLFEEAIAGSLGIITHSHFLKRYVEAKFCGLVSTIYFPSLANTEIIENDDISREKLGIADNKTLLLTVGHVNPNKRIDTTIKVLGKIQDVLPNFVYIVIGSCDHKSYYDELQKLADDYKLQDKVLFLQFQPEEVLKAYLKNADIFINLRYPAMEGASWSLIEQMYFGKPILVTDTGFYSEIPDDCLIKISTDNEYQEIESALKYLLLDQSKRLELGHNAKVFAYEAFTSKKYCENFIEFVNQVRYYRPQLELIEKVSQEMLCMRITPEMKVINKVSSTIYNFFSDSD
ncbi:glycosyltransferase family 4 protein [Nostoc commune]|uniref:glycosyltransferase family 4 protein n=1 Tax=Nostoc commune TaxID=1178 RepID=UPI0018C4512A|nr:glycosyltransferase family 4 protein [Nostoc commune]MBG1260438.1 glycosyltransferase family 4 protein [Nostoc commune BAE]